LSAAIRRAVQCPITSNSSTEAAHGTKTAGNRKQKDNAQDTDEPPLFDVFRASVVEKYGTAESAWDAMNNISAKNDGLSRTDFKRAVSSLGVAASSSEKRNLRKALDPENKKVITFRDFKAFMKTASSVESKGHSPNLAALPLDTPTLPEGYQHRENNEKQIISLLIGRISSKSSCVTAQGIPVCLLE
jgi:hypothetical protein